MTTDDSTSAMTRMFVWMAQHGLINLEAVFMLMEEKHNDIRAGLEAMINLAQRAMQVQFEEIEKLKYDLVGEQEYTHVLRESRERAFNRNSELHEVFNKKEKQLKDRYTTAIRKLIENGVPQGVANAVAAHRKIETMRLLRAAWNWPLDESRVLAEALLDIQAQREMLPPNVTLDDVDYLCAVAEGRARYIDPTPLVTMTDEDAAKAGFVVPDRRPDDPGEPTRDQGPTPEQVDTQLEQYDDSLFQVGPEERTATFASMDRTMPSDDVDVPGAFGSEKKSEVDVN
jgi:hypothetical protein